MNLDKKRSFTDSELEAFNRDGINYYIIEIDEEEDSQSCAVIDSNCNKKEIHECLEAYDNIYDVTTLYFRNCGRNAIKIPSFIQRIYWDGYGDGSTPDIKISDDNNYLEQNKIGVFSKNNEELFLFTGKDYPENKNLTLPEELKVIHNNAFAGWDHQFQFNKITIPNSVNSIGKGCFGGYEINTIEFQQNWPENFDANAFQVDKKIKHIKTIRFNESVQHFRNNNLSILDDVVEQWVFKAPELCHEESQAIGYIKLTQSYYNYCQGCKISWDDIKKTEGIIDINTRHIVSVKEYVIPTSDSNPVKGSIITYSGKNHDHLHYQTIVYEPVEMVRDKINTAVKKLNEVNDIDELVDRILFRMTSEELILKK